MILSRYSEPIVDSKGGCHLFNSINRKWISFDRQLFVLMLNHKNDIDSLENIHPDLYGVLKSEGFLAMNYADDVENAVRHVSNEYSSTDNVTITINPTLDCNLRCWYCYEERHAGSAMSENVLRNTVSYILKLLDSHDVRHLTLSFFGGEPLLHYKRVIRPMITELKALCMQTQTTLHLHFTTNGLLISERMLQEITETSNDVIFQIAFDGSGSIHNSVKNIGKGSDCYSMTLRNAVKALEAGCYVTIRCNYNKDTIGSFLQLVEDLKPYHDREKLRFLFQRIWQQPDDKEMREKKTNFVNAIEKDYTIKSNLQELSGNSLRRCYADYRHNVVVNYDGRVFRCTARNFNKENSVGRISNDGLVVEKIIGDGQFPYNEQCKQCRILPICPACYQRRLEDKSSCPFKVDETAMLRNIKAAFHDLSGIPVTI